MIDKRFKVHSMIQDMKVGEIMDLEVCEELIKKYGSLSDIHVLIEDGNDMTYQEVVDLLNENKQLKQENKKLQGEYDYLLWLYNGLGCEYDWLKDENEQLKQFKEKIFTLIDKEIDRNEEAIKWGKETGADSGAMGFYNHMLKRLKKELRE